MHTSPARDQSQFPEHIQTARLDIRWYVGGDFSVHYIEEWADGTRWECDGIGSRKTLDRRIFTHHRTQGMRQHQNSRTTTEMSFRLSLHTSLTGSKHSGASSNANSRSETEGATPPLATSDPAGQGDIRDTHILTLHNEYTTVVIIPSVKEEKLSLIMTCTFSVSSAEAC